MSAPRLLAKIKHTLLFPFLPLLFRGLLLRLRGGSGDNISRRQLLLQCLPPRDEILCKAQDVGDGWRLG